MSAPAGRKLLGWTLGRTGTAALLGLSMLALAGSGGCESLINGDVPAFNERCSGTALDACPAGEYCQGRGCAPCEGRDICDHYDNDCNGKVDDGPLSDKDGDKYTLCGAVDPTSGLPVDSDCDDNDPTVHPGAREVCNGKDDDCDGVIDDGACAAGQTCVPKTGQCIAGADACSAQSCPAPNVCDPSTQKCVARNGDLGSPCSGDLACQSGICGDDSVLTAPVAGGGVCTKPCCRSEDCGTGFVCFGPGTGGNYCVKPALLGRSTLGSLSGGASCGTTPCRSGVCGPDGLCQDTCCADRDCAPGTTCAVATLGGHGTLSCVAQPGPAAGNATCGSNGDCKSGVCAAYSDGYNTYRRCAAPCCGSAACGSFNVPGGLGGQVAVQTVCFDDVTPRGDGRVPLCDEPKAGTGKGAVGEGCQSNGDCYSDRCTKTGGSTGFCTDVCCVDADCGRPGWVCRPAQGTFLRCVPPP